MTKMLVILACLVPALASADPAKDLDKMVGAWRGSGTLTAGKDVAKVDWKADCKRTSADAGVLCTMTATGIPGLATYAETDLFGFEPHSGVFHWYAITNAGDVHDHASKAFGATSDWVFEGKGVKEAVHFAFDGNGLKVRSDDGNGVLVLELKK